MDANGTRYHLLLGKPDWARCAVDERGATSLHDAWSGGSPPVEDPGLAWDSVSNELTLRPQAYQFPTASRDTLPDPSSRRGAACDVNHNWYWIADSAEEIVVRSSGSQKTSHYWSAQDSADPRPAPGYGEFGPVASPAPPSSEEFRGLAVTVDQYLVAGTLEPQGLLIFDLFKGGPPFRLLFPKEIAFTPIDITPRPGGGVWVLDCGTDLDGRQHQRYWAFDRLFNLETNNQHLAELSPGQTDDFQPVGLTDMRKARGTAPLTAPDGLRLDAASPLELSHPISIEAMPDGSVLILDRDDADDFSKVYCFQWDQQVGEPLDTRVMLPRLAPGAYGADSEHLLQGHDLAYVAHTPVEEDQRTFVGQLFIASGEGNQTFVFNVFQAETGLEFDPLPDFLPMRLFGGKGIVTCGDQVFYDFDDQWLPLTEQRRPRYVEKAILYTPIGRDQPVFDGHDPDCTWHRLFLDACLPGGAEIVVSSRAANSLNDLLNATWFPEPQPYRRSQGSELPYATHSETYDTWELLFQRAQGRYLQLRLTLRGNGLVTPHIRALRATYPRFSYLSNYLPGVYRENENSASFADRFLAIFEGLFTEMEDRTAQAQTLLDPRSAPAEALDWLVGWFRLALDPSWDEARRRLFIANAMLFFQQRSTLNGLYIALQLAFDECPSLELFTTPLAQRDTITRIRIVEQFQTRHTPALVLGDPTEAAGLRTVSRSRRWLPEEGGAQLQARYTEFLSLQGTLADGEPATYSITPPASRGLWQQFSQTVLGFAPSTDPADRRRWQSFLMHRYRSIDALNDRYRLIAANRYAAFEDIDLPAELPRDGPPLADWYQFQTVVLGMHQTAHHFAVLLPMPAGVHFDPGVQAERLTLAKHVIDMEKPAHTTYDVKFYWAMFRLGEVRLGYDTVLGEGGRSPEFMSPMILGQGQLVQSYLGPARVAPEGRSYLAGDN